MTFEEVIVDLKALIGKRIESVRPGAPVVLRSIDETGGSLILEDKSGNTKSRPLKVLPVAAVYGNNASGKSQFIAALSFLRSLVIEEFKTGRLPLAPFRG